jgi:osmotically-inducible protein OsmY
VDATHIAVAVRNRAVTLAGHARNYGEKWAAVAAAERVYGVRAVADELAVESSLEDRPDDQSLAEEIGHRLSGDVAIPEIVFAEVREGRVILRGEVETAFQKEEAERVVSGITGVLAISNGIKVGAA